MRTFRRRLLLSCRVLAEKMFVGETSGRVLTLVLLRNWYVVQEIHLAPTPRMLRRLDADADKAMFLRCAVFGTVCLPIFALIDMGMTIIACFRPSSYAGCFRSLR